MAAKSYEAGVRKYYGDKLTDISDDTTSEEIRHVYDNWASEYNKVTIISSDPVFMGPDKFFERTKTCTDPPFDYTEPAQVYQECKQYSNLQQNLHGFALCKRVAQAKKFVRLKLFPDTSKQGQFRSQVKLRLMVFILNSASPRVKRVATGVSKFSARSQISLKNSKFSFSLLQSPCKYIVRDKDFFYLTITVYSPLRRSSSH